MMRFGGIANIVIPAKAGIQTWRPLRPSPLDSRFRGNDTGKRAIGSVLKQQALGRWSRAARVRLGVRRRGQGRSWQDVLPFSREREKVARSAG